MPNTDAIQQELLAKERQYWNAIKEKDAATALSLSDEDCLVVGAQGIGALSKAALEKMLRGASYELRDFSIEELRLRPISEDVMAVAYKVREELELEGRTIRLVAYDTSLWTRRDGQWVCAMHTESLAGDPFGRH
ncbi:nuclear transport factor 2 family protein [Pelomonas sp. BJYL3]|uniref:nuclear transport factor 2 family protein n=1 Tax=Pelomonas sp. BJYL3 TaxID=2976697 RepID=UPI0022B45A0F|nr:nuclear transport factor 2 family protein [Pelomonas sp. BJYL3]